VKPGDQSRPEGLRFAYLQLHLLVALLATTAILGELISLSSTALVIWRTMLAALGGAALLVVLPGRSLLPPPGMLLRLLGVGCVVGLHWMCFFGSIRLANISICLAGMATISFFTAFTEPFFDRRRVRPLEVWLGALVLLGILLIAGFERGRIAGLLVALLGAFLAAIFPVLNHRLVNHQKLDPLVMVTWEMLGACLICLAALPWIDGSGAYLRIFDLKGLDWLWLLLLAWVCTVFAHAFHIYLLKFVSAYTGNLAMNFEPIYGIAAAALVFGEHRQLHPGFFIGTGAIVAANILHPLILRSIIKRKSVGLPQ
jgi:drug/metabolite transporter (DMT)-like permease